MSAIVNNMVVLDKGAGTKYRVLDVVGAAAINQDDAKRYVVLIELNIDKAPMPHGVPQDEMLDHLASRRWVPVEDDHVSIELNALSEGARKVLEFRWGVLRQALSSGFNLYHPGGRAELARSLARKGVTTRPVLYTVLRQYWVFGPHKQSLIPNFRNCGAPGKERVPLSQARKTGRPRSITPGRGIVMTQEHRRKLSIAIGRTTAGKDARWLAEAYDQLLIKQYPEHVFLRPNKPRPQVKNYDAVPTKGQFLYHWKREHDYQTRLRKRHRARKFDLLTKVLSSGTLRDLRGPGSRYEIDATIVDVYVVSRFNSNHIIGRPTLYLVLDQFSRLIVGYYIGLEPPCWAGAMLALWSCNLDKVDICRRHGIEITSEQWPTGYMPVHLLGDRGEAFSKMAEALSAGFNIDIENSPPYRGDAKSIVERTFGSIQTGPFGAYVPGYVDKQFLGRGEKPPQLNAALDLEQLTRVLLAAIVMHNHHVIREYLGTPQQIVEGVEFTPVALWNWGVKHLRFEGRRFTEDHLARYLWPEKKLKLSRRGLQFYRGLYYFGTKLKEQEWYLRALMEEREFSVRFHPHYLSDLLLIADDQRGTMLKLPVSRRSEQLSQRSLWELVALENQKDRQNEA